MIFHREGLKDILEIEFILRNSGFLSSLSKCQKILTLAMVVFGIEATHGQKQFYNFSTLLVPTHSSTVWGHFPLASEQKLVLYSTWISNIFILLYQQKLSRLLKEVNNLKCWLSRLDRARKVIIIWNTYNLKWIRNTKN